MYYFHIFIKKTLRYLLKPLSFLPALCMMSIIYSFSAQTGEASGELSLGVTRIAVLSYNRIFAKGFSNEELELMMMAWHLPIRKAAHIAAYFLLSITVSFPLYVYRIRGFFLYLTCGVFCLLFAFFDEYHQSFVSGRSPSVTDVGIDGIGIFLGILTAEILCFIGRKTIFRSLSLEQYHEKKREYERSQEGGSPDAN